MESVPSKVIIRRRAKECCWRGGTRGWCASIPAGFYLLCEESEYIHCKGVGKLVKKKRGSCVNYPSKDYRTFERHPSNGSKKMGELNAG